MFYQLLKMQLKREIGLKTKTACLIKYQKPFTNLRLKKGWRDWTRDEQVSTKLLFPFPTEGASISL